MLRFGKARLMKKIRERLDRTVQRKPPRKHIITCTICSQPGHNKIGCPHKKIRKLVA